MAHDAPSGVALHHDDDSTEYVGESDQGVSGLLHRSIEVKEDEFKKFLGVEVQYDMEQGLAEKGLGTFSNWWSRSPKSVLGLPIISPLSAFTVTWMSLITLMDLTYAAFWVPLNVAFCSNNYGQLSSGCARADMAGGVIYTIHLLLNFSVGMVMTHEYKKRVVLDGSTVASIYIRHGRFWLDFVSVLPFIYLVVIVAGEIPATRWVAIASLFRLVRMSRLVSIGGIVFMDAQRGDDNSRFLKLLGGSRGAYLLIVFIGLATIVNLQACMLILVAQFMGPENSWMQSFPWIDLPNASVFLQWYEAVYVVIASNTQTGAAGAKFSNQGEFAVCIIMQVVGMVMFTLIVTVGLLFMTKVSKYGMNMYRLGNKLRRVRLFLATHNLPEHMHKPVLSFYYQTWLERVKAVREDAVVADMPPFLRAGLLMPVTRSLVCGCHYLHDCGPEVQTLVAQALLPVEMIPGVELCTEGEAANCCWLLERGVVRASNMQGAVELLPAPCLFGEAFIVSADVPTCRERLWRYEVVAGGLSGAPAKLWRLKAADLHIISRAYPELCTGLLQYLQGKLVCELSPGVPNGAFPGADGHWNEVVSRIAAMLHTSSAALVTDVRLQLLQATVESGTLSELLESLLALSMVNRSDHAVLLRAVLSGASKACTQAGVQAQAPTTTSHPPDIMDNQDSAAGQQQQQQQQQPELRSTPPHTAPTSPVPSPPPSPASSGLEDDRQHARSPILSSPGTAPSHHSSSQPGALGDPGPAHSPRALSPLTQGSPGRHVPSGAHGGARQELANLTKAAPPSMAPIFSYSPRSPGRPPPPLWAAVPAATTGRVDRPRAPQAMNATGSKRAVPWSGQAFEPSLATRSANTSNNSPELTTRPSRAAKEQSMYLQNLQRNPTALLKAPPEQVWQSAEWRRQRSASILAPGYLAYGGDALLSAAAEMALFAASDSEADPRTSRNSRAAAAAAVAPAEAAAAAAGEAVAGQARAGVQPPAAGTEAVVVHRESDSGGRAPHPFAAGVGSAQHAAPAGAAGAARPASKLGSSSRFGQQDPAAPGSAPPSLEHPVPAAPGSDPRSGEAAAQASSATSSFTGLLFLPQAPDWGDPTPRASDPGVRPSSVLRSSLRSSFLDRDRASAGGHASGASTPPAKRSIRIATHSTVLNEHGSRSTVMTSGRLDSGRHPSDVLGGEAAEEETGPRPLTQVAPEALQGGQTLDGGLAASPSGGVGRGDIQVDAVGSGDAVGAQQEAGGGDGVASCAACGAEDVVGAGLAPGERPCTTCGAGLCSCCGQAM